MPLPDPLASYDAALTAGQVEITRLLRAAIHAALPGATSKVWHGHPVWFDGENPVVGYDARKKSVNLLFWNGQALGEAALVPVGKFKAAGTQYAAASEVDSAALRRWLEKARADVFDGVTYFRKLREAARRRKAAGGARTGAPARGRVRPATKTGPAKKATPAKRKRQEPRKR